jgi:puromycin N-acetyltransferase
VAVTPEAQGSGVGTRLLRHRLAEIDDAGAAAYLEATTPASRQLYERLGFVEQRALDMTPSGQPVAMLRPAGEQR